MRLPLPLFLLPLTLAQKQYTTQRLPTVGVPKSKLDLYKPLAGSSPPEWRCLDGRGGPMPFSAINDDFCDCEDGSDEPGTSACKGGTFHCVNEGHLPHDIPNMRVNDGLCDPECCDGSDEPDGVCPDACGVLGEAYRAAMEQDRKLRKTGAKIRSSYVAFAKKEKKRLEDALVKERNNVEEKTREEERQRAILEHAETMSAEAMAHKQKSPLYQSLQSHSSALTHLTQKVSLLETQLATLKTILSELETGHNPNFQDMGVRGAIHGWHEFLKNEGGATEGDEEREAGAEGEVDQEEEDMTIEERDEEWTDDRLKKLGQMDLTGLLLAHDEHITGYPSSSSEGSILFAIEHYLPEPWVPIYESSRAFLIKWLIKFGVVKGVVQSTDSAETTRARAAHSDALKALREAEDAVRKDEEALGKLESYYGPEAEWKKLDGTCIEKNTGEYTYSVCFFGQANQKPNSGGSWHNLGTFSRWNDASPQGTIDYYSEQVYDRGAKCWNGPERSVHLHLTCGTENALLSIQEPQKCEYHFEGTTPALCWPLETDNSGKDEL